MKIDVALSKTLPKFLDKAILPQSLLQSLILNYGESDLPHPMIFQTTLNDNKKVYFGVREFDSDERFAIPWVVQQYIGDLDVDLTLADIPKALGLVLKPLGHHVPNWKYFLEAKLRQYTVIVQDTILRVNEGDKVYELYVEKSEPAPVVCIVDTDVDLDISGETVMESNEIVKDLGNGAAGDEFTLSNDKANHLIRISGKKGSKVYLEVLEGDADLVDMVAGPSELTNRDCYTVQTMTNGLEEGISVELDELFVLPIVWGEGQVKVKMVLKTIQKNENAINDGSERLETSGNIGSVCSNCEQIIPSGRLVLHESFCKRNNIRCECGQVFLREIPSSHWKCDKCSKHGDGEVCRVKHDQIFHQGPYKCDQCSLEIEYDNLIELITTHKAIDCPQKLHECRFCHLIVPQEESTYMDRYNGLTHHESDCGNRTVECPICNKIVRVKDLQNHSSMHELAKAEFSDNVVLLLERCANQNCTSVRDTNELQLCSICYGPLYAQGFDPSGAKLKNRLERKYVMQLLKGCGNPWCKNKCCKSLGLSTITTMQECVKEARKQLQYVHRPVLPGVEVQEGDNQFWFCVDQNTTQRKLMVEYIVSQGQFRPELVLKAVNEVRDVSEVKIKDWLETHAIKV